MRIDSTGCHRLCIIYLWLVLVKISMSIHISFFCLSWLSSFSVFSVIFIFIFNRSAFLLLFCCLTGDLTRRSDHTCRYICSTPVRFKTSRSFAFTKHFSMGSSSRLADQCDTFNCRPFSIFAPIQMLIFFWSTRDVIHLFPG